MDMSMDINDQRTKQYYKKYMSATLSVPVVEDVQLHHDDQSTSPAQSSSPAPCLASGGGSGGICATSTCLDLCCVHIRHTGGGKLLESIRLKIV